MQSLRPTILYLYGGLDEDSEGTSVHHRDVHGHTRGAGMHVNPWLWFFMTIFGSAVGTVIGGFINYRNYRKRK